MDCTQASRFAKYRIVILSLSGRGLVRHTAWLLGRRPIQVPALLGLFLVTGDGNGVNDCFSDRNLKHCRAVGRAC